MDGADGEGVDHANRHHQRYEAPGPGEVDVWLQMIIFFGFMS